MAKEQREVGIESEVIQALTNLLDVDPYMTVEQAIAILAAKAIEEYGENYDKSITE